MSIPEQPGEPAITEQPGEPITEPTAADRYDEAVSAIEAPVIELYERANRNRMMIRLLAISIVLDVVLSVVTGFATIYAIHASNVANSATKAAGIACTSRNDFKALDLARWQYIVKLSAGNAPKTATPAEKAATAKQTKDFEAFIGKADAPEAC